MSPELYAAFVAATLVLMLIPGPNVAVIAANSVAHGPRYGLLTVAGTSSAMVLQLAVTALGMTSLLTQASHLFEVLRWAGVAYLVWLALKAFRERPVDLSQVGPQPRSARTIYLRGLVVSLSNPKTLFFYGAFFPQFVTPGPAAGGQIALLSATFLALAILVDGCWALLAGRFRSVLGTNGRLRNRLTGGFYLAAAAGLASARRAS